MALVLLGLNLADGSWSGPAIAVALIVCLLLMVALGGLMHASATRLARDQSSLQSLVHQAASPGNRRGDTEAIRAMLRSRPIVLEELGRREHLQVRVTGLTCAGESAGLAHTLNQYAGVIEVIVNPLTERAYVTYDPLIVDVADVEAMIRSAGYGVG
jgi:copper chaperone CopZ